MITRHNSLPTTPVPPPSLEWDRSCLQDPFLAGQDFLGGIERLDRRKKSATDPNLVDNDQILLVSTDYSSFSSSLEKLVESAGKISSSVMANVENEADDLFSELDTLSSGLEANPANKMYKYSVETFFSRVESMADDLQACLKLYKSTLPMRGKGEGFLQSNRATAKCILDQQCKKISKNPEDVRTTLKAFQKLFDKGHGFAEGSPKRCTGEIHQQACTTPPMLEGCV